MIPRTNLTSSIRSGFDYQNLWGLKFCCEILKNPTAFKWICFETVPEEAGSGRFYLDDILLLDNDDSYHLYQIKHRQDFNNAWTWTLFLNSNEKRSSLFQRWGQSFFKVNHGKLSGASFITNAMTDDDIARFLENKKINIEKIKEQNQELYTNIVAQFDSEEKAVRFFSLFEFRFGEKGLLDLEKEVKDEFYSDLRATESGFNNLQLQIHKECRQPQTHSLDVEQLQQWCEFDKPRHLKEEFFIPEDFEFFNEVTHEEILKDLIDIKGGIRIIVGKPGTGKSVYLSKLHNTLSDKKILSIRHHYHLSPDDTNPQERLNADRVIEALKAQFKQYPDKLGSLATKNSANVTPKEFINSIASHLFERGKTLVLIIDGLDHVLRNADAEELNKFIQHICYPQPGLWIVLGMQHSVDEYLPAIIKKLAPSDKWIEMIGLNRDAVRCIIEKNNINLNLPDNGNMLLEVVNKVYDITQGNPLHLRYVLCELKFRHGNGLITEYSLRNIIAYGGDIENYYKSLWQQLSDKTKTILFTISTVNFVFTRNQLLECISSFENDPSELSQSFRSIQHLIKEDRKNRISVYHNSFQIFLLKQPQFEEQKLILKRHIKDWLSNCSYENLKWAELRKIEYELGNPDILLELNKEWLMEAITYPRNSSQITTQLLLASQAAFEKNDFPKTLLFSQLTLYYLNSAEFVEKGYKMIFAESIQLNQEVLEDIEFQSLRTSNLLTLAGMANEKGDFILIEEILNELIGRQHIREDYFNKDSIPSVPYALMKTLPFDRNRELKQVYDYIKSFNRIVLIPDLFEIYTSQLLALDQVNKVKDILRFELTQEEKNAVLVQCESYDIEHNSTVFEEYYLVDSSLFVSLYRALKGNFKIEFPELPSFDIFTNKVPDYDPNVSEKWTSFFYDYFLIGLLYGLADREDEVKEWITNKPDKWGSNALAVILEATVLISKNINTKSRFDYKDLFSPLKKLRVLHWLDDRDEHELQNSLKKAIYKILQDVLLIKKVINDSLEIGIDSFEDICVTSFFSKDDLLKVLIEKNKVLLSHEAYESLLRQKIKELENSVSYFPDRTVAYAELTALARLQGDFINAKKLLLKASDNLLGYGYHKDLYLHEVLEMIEFCAQAGTSQETINEWLKRISPIIENVNDFTDGDNTYHLPLNLADILGKYDKESLYKNYYANAEKENMFHAENLFKSVIKSMHYETDQEIALGATAIDKESFEELKLTAQKSDGAQKALKVITEYLGDISELENPRTTSQFNNKSEDSVYSLVSPEQLNRKLQEISSKSLWDQERYLEKWLSHWSNKRSKEKAYHAIISYVKHIGLIEISGRLLDKIYPLAYEFDNAIAFELLCRAQANDNGWKRFFTDKFSAINRWLCLKDKYPNRHLEFLKKSIEYSYQNKDDIGRFIPLSRGVEFLLLFDDITNAEKITDASITFSEQLMADIQLQPPIWNNEPYINLIVDEIDVLIQRLLWPSTLIRERAANSLAWLFCYSSKREEIFNRFLLQLRMQTMESIVAIFLLPIFRAFQIQENKIDLSYINFEKIANSLSVGSIIINKLLEELAGVMKANLTEITWPGYAPITHYEDAYEINEFFQKHIMGFLPPIYYSWAQKIESQSSKNFIKQWSFTSDVLINENKIERNVEVARFQGDEKGPTITGFSTKLSEVYRTAFIRVIQQFFAEGLLHEDYYLEYAYATLPIDLSFWKINPSKIPEWWPKLKSLNTSSITQVNFEPSIESLIEQTNNSNIILFAEGSIPPFDGWNGNNPEHFFTLIGFAYRVEGSDTPEAEKVAEILVNDPARITLIPSKTSHPFNFFDNYSDLYPIHTSPKPVDDLILYPLVVRCKGLVISLWQYFRYFNKFTILTPYIQRDLLPYIEKNSYSYRIGDTKVAFASDWLEGLQERNDSELPLPHGQWLEIEKPFIDSILTSNGLRLGYLLKSTSFHRKDVYSDVETLEQFRLINVSGIILPKTK